MQLPHMLALARAVLELPLVVDRVGGPLGIGPFAGRQAEVFPEWKQQMLELAALANVMVKLGGLAMYVTGFDFHRRPRPPGSEELAKIWRPYIDTCIEAFSADRCMFESYFPVDKGMCSYPVLWNAFKRLVAGAARRRRRRCSAARRGACTVSPDCPKHWLSIAAPCNRVLSAMQTPIRRFDRNMIRN